MGHAGLQTCGRGARGVPLWETGKVVAPAACAYSWGGAMVKRTQRQASTPPPRAK